ncbi:hypothetical protein F4054_15535 [Candidatus Poribacteria bacterium]|nr:hypothetical protein [Candidatus Poribacteria bacterium]MYG08723.1 hypothetical protein [Candidatus Poribacteria bacterium]MYK23654.1 hypothetical protein [Candidatus Poribacteria bacterium]
MKTRTLGAAVLISSIVVLACFIRIQSTANIPTGQLTAPDAYFYYWQAHLVAEQGHLPARDMHRWLPLGRDLGQKRFRANPQSLRLRSRLRPQSSRVSIS